MSASELATTSVSQLALAQRRETTPAIWEMILSMAPVMHRSRLFGVTSPEAAAAVMLKGYELGLGLTASFEFVQIIQGRPGLSPRGALAILMANPEIEKIEIKRLPAPTGPFEGYECFMRRRNGFEHRSRFTMEDAKRAGVVKPDSGWSSYPENMCLWRAVGFAADVVAPDITAGMTAIMKMPESLGVSLTQDGDVIEGQWSTPATDAPSPVSSESPPPPIPSTTRQPAPAITLEDLLTKWTAEEILVAGEGKLPATDEELAAIVAKLSPI